MKPVPGWVNGLNLVGTKPSQPRIGDAFWDITTHCMQVWNGTQWIMLIQNAMAFEEMMFPSLKDYVIQEEP